MVLLEAVDGLPVQLVPGGRPGARPEAGDLHHLFVRQVGIAAGGEGAGTGAGDLEETPAVHWSYPLMAPTVSPSVMRS